MQVGVAGLGKMGAAIAARLMEVGHQVTVWNRSPDKAKPLADAGAKVADSPAALAKASEIVITILTDAPAIDTVYGGANGLLSGDVKGKLFLEMSTVRPETQVALAAKVKAKSASLVECPVGGTVGPARQGKLLGLVGAELADFAKVKPLLDQLCRRVEHCGPVGAGESVKLAVNLPLMIAWQAYGEAFAICRHVGFEPKRLVDLFTDISATNNAFKARAPMIATMLEGGDPGPTTFDIASAVKDLKTMRDEGKARGVDLPLIERTLACFEEANAAGLGAQDGAAIPVYWSRRGKK
ncbi:MAG: NAD(P)-dependent oxidoreductase [Pseudolabrys sp.]|nr:NAD(P)-dependent oxidoreductase [Pseudolabrys sp.]